MTYDLGHLDEKIVTVESGGESHSILVRFSDHCFTVEAVDNDSRPKFDRSTRQDGRFCTERYAASLKIWEYLEKAWHGRLWMGEHDRYLLIAVTVGEGSDLCHYIIALTLEKITGRSDAKLLMRVRTAFVRTPDKHVATFGEVRFANLIALTLKGKSPPRIFDQKRKKPWVK